MAQIKLNKTFKRKWIAALLSGKYKQGSSLLCKKSFGSNKMEHCCLGVAMEVLGYKPRKEADSDHHYMYIYDGEEYFSMIPSGIAKKIGFSHGSNDDYQEVLYYPQILSRFNDNGKSFKWIAAYIKRYF